VLVRLVLVVVVFSVIMKLVSRIMKFQWYKKNIKNSEHTENKKIRQNV